MQDILEMILGYCARLVGRIIHAFADEKARHGFYENIAHTAAEAAVEKLSPKSENSEGNTPQSTEERFLVIETIPEAMYVSLVVAFCAIPAIAIDALIEGNFSISISSVAKAFQLSILIFVEFFTGLVVLILARSRLINLNRKIRMWACLAVGMFGMFFGGWVIATYVFTDLF